MQLETNFIGLEKEIDKYSLNTVKHIHNSIRRLGIEAELDAKNTINTFVNSKGHNQGVNSGDFRDGVHSDVVEGGYGFALRDSVDYGVYHEFGTEEHFVPFVDAGGSLTSLGKWAVLHFDDLGFTAVGKSGKTLEKPTRASREEVVIAKGGMMVSLDEMAPFRMALEHVQRIAPKIFEEEFSK